MKIGVSLGWRPEKGRIAAHDFCTAWWHKVLPEAEVFDTDTDHDRYNRGAARNAGVREAESKGCDVVILADADTIFEPVPDWVEIAKTALADGQVHMPHLRCHSLSKRASRHLIETGVPPTSLEGGWESPGACYVLAPSTHWKCGGFDERFVGWGGEDDQYVSAATCLVGLVHHDYVALSLWHPAWRDKGSPRVRANLALAQHYLDAVEDPAAMRALIAERLEAAPVIPEAT